TIRYTTTVDVMPLFIRKGAIIPTGAVGTSTENVTDSTITYELYPDTSKTTFTMYEDDGESYDYEHGEYAITELQLQKSDDVVTFHVAARQGDYAVPPRDAVVKLHYRSIPSKVTLNGAELTLVTSMDAFEAANGGVWYYDATAGDAQKAVYVKYNDTGAAQTVTMTVGEEPEQEIPGGVVSNATRYECEAETTQRVGAGVATVVGASGEKVVNSVGNEGNSYFIMNGITVEEDGVYSVDIGCGSGETRQCMLSINGGEPIRLHFASTGSFSSISSMQVKLPLQKGENTLKFYTLKGEGWAPDFDYIDLYDAQSIDTREKIYYTPDSNNTKGAVIATNSFAYSGKVATDFVDSSCSVSFANVASQKRQPKEIVVSYASIESGYKKLTLTVNGQSQTLTLSSTHSEHLFNTVMVTAYLEEGENVLQLSGVAGQSEGVSLAYVALLPDVVTPPESDVFEQWTDNLNPLYHVGLSSATSADPHWNDYRYIAQPFVPESDTLYGVHLPLNLTSGNATLHTEIRSSLNGEALASCDTIFTSQGNGMYWYDVPLDTPLTVEVDKTYYLVYYLTDRQADSVCI
ncbi:MAG: DUF5110 domain-containing protein, partial [Clostridia bacterium]|nr:DUF5110 domain-containing protein [Clostridia bacterium]